jgi:hypothetical protein
MSTGAHRMEDEDQAAVEKDFTLIAPNIVQTVRRIQR